MDGTVLSHEIALLDSLHSTVDLNLYIEHKKLYYQNMTDQDVGKQHGTYFLHIQYFLFRSHSCINGPGFVLVHHVTSAPLKCPVTCRRVYLYYIFAPVHLLPVWGKVDFTLGVLALVIHLHYLCVTYVACKMKKKEAKDILS